MTLLPPAPATKKAAKAFLGRPIRKYFEPNAEEGTEGGWFDGKVASVQSGVVDKDTGEVFDLVFRIKYDDGDGEDMTWEMLQEVLVHPTTPVPHQLALATEAEAAAAEEGKGDEENEPVAFEPRGGRAGPSFRAGSMSDITNHRSKQARGGSGGDGWQTLTAGAERRSRRPTKRKADEDFEYEEDVKAAKKGAGALAGASRLGAKFGIRAPGGAPSALAALGGATAGPGRALASESSEEALMVNGVRGVGLPGHLVKIELINFMCHEHFTMEFGLHVTFVSGTNGSGKSAVLQALQCCLGVKANQTGRAPNFKHFIRTGTDEAIVRVTLYNKPYKDHDAFQHDVYGDLITVERRIARLGTASAYFLKDKHGRVHGKTRGDLDALLHTLNINAANPVTVMTQDTARSFLAGSSAAADREKWTLYMDATQLSQIRYNLEVSQSQIRLMDESVAKIRGDFEALQADHDGLAKAIEALRGLEVWRREIGLYAKVLAWASVDELEQSVARLEGHMATTVPQRLAVTEAKLSELEMEFNALRQSTSEKEQFLVSYNERARGLSAEAEALKAQRNEAHKALVGAKRKLQALERRLAEEAARKESLVAAATEATHQEAAATQAVTLAYTRELEEADKQYKQQDAQSRAALEERDAAQRALDQAREAVARVEEDQNGNTRQVKRVMESMAQLKQAKANALAKWGGKEMVGLVKLVQQEGRRFHRPPVGPLGHYLELADNKWARAVEAAISIHLNGFLVSDLHDCRLLQELIRRAGFPTGWRRPAVTVVKFDIPAHTIPPSRQPPPRVQTVLRVLRCTHPQQAHSIINHLVDAASIEKTALGEGPQRCSSLGFGTPQVKACFDLDGSKYYQRGKSQSSIGPPHWMKFRALRLGAGSAQQQTEGLQEELRGLQQEAGMLQQELAVAEQGFQAACEALRAARLVCSRLQQVTWRSKTRLETLMSQPPPEVAATQAAAGGSEEDEVQREILEATQAVVDLEQQLGDKRGEVEVAERAEQAAAEAWHAKKEEIDRLTDENAQFVGSFQADMEKLAQVEADLQATSEEHQATLRVQADRAAQLAAQQEEAAGLTALAEQFGSREEAAQARAELVAAFKEKEGMDDAKLERWFTTGIMRKKIDRLQRKIHDHEKQAGGTLADLEVKFEAVQAKMNSDGRRFQNVIAAYNLMDSALKRRFKKLAELFRSVQESVNRRFNGYMARKGHLGSIKLDKENQTLQLKVQIGGKGAGGDAGKVKDLKQLSGGERSFTTVAFSLALGAETDMPFRCSDEFDVFMDAVNRRVAMESLFSFAREHDDLQFIFLTPQDIAAVEDARQGCARAGLHLPEDFVKVVQMRAARENAAHA